MEITLRKKFKIFLAENDLTLVQFAKNLDYHHCYISNVMCGRKMPRYQLMKKIEIYTKGKIKVEDFLLQQEQKNK
jgi:hypothetical protein